MGLGRRVAGACEAGEAGDAMSSLFNRLYHGSIEDVEELLEGGVELDAQLTGALLCNMVRRIRRLEQQAQARQDDAEARCPDCGSAAIEEAIGQVCGECGRGVIE